MLLFENRRNRGLTLCEQLMNDKLGIHNDVLFLVLAVVLCDYTMAAGGRCCSLFWTSSLVILGFLATATAGMCSL